MQKTVFISGGGPCGLAAALMFQQRGWQRIVVAEKSASASTFDKNKGFNYLIDARGQKLLKHLGIVDKLKTYGVENERGIMTMVMSDGSQKIFKSPFWDPLRDSAFWSRRENLQILLHEAIEECNDGRIELLYGHAFAGLEFAGDNTVQVRVTPETGGSDVLIHADFALGCDGLRSEMREAMIAHSGLPETRFDRVLHPSPSSELNYKVLSMPARVPLRGDMPAADNNKMAYAFISQNTNPEDATALVAYPVASSDEPRTVNIIRLTNHVIWGLETPEEVLDFLEEAFPQLPVRNVISQREAEDFVAFKATTFPVPQYTRQCFAQIGSGDGIPALLLGDAAHAFPPDLGLGVNTALEDVFILNRYLDETGDDPCAASRAFDAGQAGERAALVKLVQSVAPYQYNQIPWKLKLWALRFFAVKGLNRLLPFWVDQPAVLLAQQDSLTFSEIRRRQVANRYKIGAVFAAIAAGLVAVT
jgi:kynurenine 3-monooxygenase